MQEEINRQAAQWSEKAVVLVAKGGAKLTADVIKGMMRAFLNGIGHGDRGKMTVKTLIRKDAGVQNIEITDQNIKPFEKIARKYGVDYAIKKAEDKYLVFFKARDADALTAAFAEYTAETVGKERAGKPSLRRRLEQFKEKVAHVVRREKHREKGAR